MGKSRWLGYEPMGRPRSGLTALTLDDFDLNFDEFISYFNFGA